MTTCRYCVTKIKQSEDFAKFYWTGKGEFPLIIKALKFFLKEKNFRKGSVHRHSLEHIIEDFERK